MSIMNDFIPKEYGDDPHYKPVMLSGEYLSRKIAKLIDLGLMYTMEDIINLTGTYFLFTIPLCAN